MLRALFCVEVVKPEIKLNVTQLVPGCFSSLGQTLDCRDRHSSPLVSAGHHLVLTVKRVLVKVTVGKVITVIGEFTKFINYVLGNRSGECQGQQVECDQSSVKEIALDVFQDVLSLGSL